MGNKCGCSRGDEEQEKLRLKNLIRIQAVARSYLAKKQRKGLREQRIRNLFSK
jgi:hypothetical protein